MSGARDGPYLGVDFGSGNSYTVTDPDGNVLMEGPNPFGSVELKTYYDTSSVVGLGDYLGKRRDFKAGDKVKVVQKNPDHCSNSRVGKTGIIQSISKKGHNCKSEAPIKIQYDDIDGWDVYYADNLELVDNEKVWIKDIPEPKVGMKLLCHNSNYRTPGKVYEIDKIQGDLVFITHNDGHTHADWRYWQKKNGFTLVEE